MTRGRIIAGAAVVLALAIPASFAVLKTGDTFVPFSLKNIDGRDYTVAMEEGRLTLLVSETVDGELRIDKSHPDAVLLDFWATWCVPCRKAMPHMQDLHEKFKPSSGQDEGGLRLFGIALDEKGSRVVKPFYEKLKITYPMLVDPTSGDGGDAIVRSAKDMKGRYKVQEIPVVYLIDARGKITHVHVGFKEEHVAELDAAVAALVGGGGDS
jgi:thiol-disulfide isomerase/thioredoxin